MHVDRIEEDRRPCEEPTNVSADTCDVDLFLECTMVDDVELEDSDVIDVTIDATLVGLFEELRDDPFPSEDRSIIGAAERFRLRC